jgi:hypothetical protein
VLSIGLNAANRNSRQIVKKLLMRLLTIKQKRIKKAQSVSFEIFYHVVFYENQII